MKILYHGTDIDSAREICKSQIIDVTRGAKHTDFGQGFYVTDDYERATRWAYRKAGLRGKKPAVITIVFDEKAAKNIIEYFSDDLRWGRFIINNRNGLAYIKNVAFKDNNLDARYDITCGRIADIDIIDVADELKENGMMLISLDRILNKEYPIQYAFHTEQSTVYIKKMSYRSLV